MFTSTKGTRYDHNVKLNVILMISDCFGPASETFARGFVHHISNLSLAQRDSLARWTFPDGAPEQFQGDTMPHLPLDPLLVGSSRTRSSNSLVTDSAAGATAFACGIKTYNAGAISVEPVTQKPCGTVLEAAKHRGYLTGLVTTSRITHATPAVWYSHVVSRDMESQIAPFLIGQGPLGSTVDLAFGGGRGFFIPKSFAGSRRSDEEDLLDLAKTKYNFNLLNNTQAFEEQWKGGDGEIRTPVLAFFNDDHMHYEIDRVSLDPTGLREPSLRNMSLAALQTLSREAHSQSAHGFFMMIEGARIDMAAHSNDPIGHLYDILAYQETVRTVKTWVDEANKAGWPTLMISVSDHETGGLALGRQLTSAYPEYAWYPEVLVNATHSTAWLGDLIGNQTQPISRNFIVETVLRDSLGIQDASEKEINNIIQMPPGGNFDYALSDMVSRRAQLGWSTHGHSGVDVNLYAWPPELTESLRANVENTYIGKFITEAMQIDLGVVTTDLNRLAKSWHITSDSDTTKDQLKTKQYSHEF
ncbi:alkaline-phosphatase-like protein [Melampsora americana]|nr:alkaline-phosphatase-like protein [Melampsora americana]